MRNRFDAQLDELGRTLTLMGALCENAIAGAVRALVEGDRTLAASVARAEEEIDRKEREIEGMCLKLLLQQQPVARDLRLISAALKMITDIERIGDQAADIAELTAYLPAGSVSPHIETMGRETIGMVTDALDAYVRRDLTLAQQVVTRDDVVDDLFATCKRELIASITTGQVDGERVLDVLMVAKYLERIGDHAVNIAEWVAFSMTGEHQ